MEAGQKLLLGALSAMVLCIGLYLLFFETRIVTQLFESVRDQIKDEELYQQYYKVEKDVIPYEELMAILLNHLEYDIMIDGVSFKKDEHDMDKIAGYGLKKTNYLKEYQYDVGGNIIMITYASMSG